MPSSTPAQLHELRVRLSTPEFDQAHLFQGFPEDPAQYTAEQSARLQELLDMQTFYTGGIEAYLSKAKQLLIDARKPVKTPFSAISNPTLLFQAPAVSAPSAELDRLEALGTPLLQKTAYIITAGGLGERLGFSGIKLALPTETATHTCFLAHYLSFFREVTGPLAEVVIMTSDDTHQRTVQLLEALKPEMPNIRLVKQETVFCLSDNQAHIALKAGKLARKPHGNGDVHSILYCATVGSQSLMVYWASIGIAHLVFLQDTNAFATLTIPSSMGYMLEHHLHMVFTCIPRKPKEAVGLLCQVTDAATQKSRCQVVEYNVFESVSQGLKLGGDVSAPGSIYSPFPGSVNTLLFDFVMYRELLEKSQGLVPEFINPKYTDDTKTAFKSPTRVESLMEDFALLFDSAQNRIAAVIYGRDTFHPVKNTISEANGRVLLGVDAHCAASGEESVLHMNRCRLRAVGVQVHPAGASQTPFKVAENISSQLFPVVAFDGCFAGRSLMDLKYRFPHPERVHISGRSTLIVYGNVVLESLELDGALVIHGPAGKGSAMVVQNVKTSNAGWAVRALTAADTEESDRIRNFVYDRKETHELGTPVSH